ncbi:MAG: ABC transporter substrate-binding protein [Bacteroidaceae bacterium]|nr:ABC transporter substrate-binding protein [Bacteroidaceae bacterium]
MQKKIGLLFILLFLLGSAAFSRTIRISPQWTPQAQFAGLYIAEKKGFFKDLGVDVKIVHPAAATHSDIDMLREGETDIAMSQLLDVLSNYDAGFHMLNVLQTNERSSLLIVSRDTVNGVEDLRGKTIGNWKAGFSDCGFMMDSEYGLDINWVSYNNTISVFLSGVFDATLAMDFNEYYQILMSGMELSDKNVIRISDYVIDAQEDGYYVTPEFYQECKEEIGKCVTAIKEAWEWARIESNRDEAVDIVMEKLKEFNVKSNRIHQRYMLDTILKNMETKSGVAPYMVDRQRFDQLVSLMKKYGFLLNDVEYDDIVINFEK